jgi:4-amino-4-deoxy-L-arabinose transferase-like glycosyltransferase
MIDERRLRPALAAAVFLVALAISAFAVYPRPDWQPDGYAYAVRMLLDLGVPFQEALHRAQAFYQQLPIAANPAVAPLLRGDQPPLYWDVFKPRLLYPLFAAVLFPLRGFYGMLDITVVAYVLTALAVYYLVLQFTGALPSFVVTLGFMIHPTVLLLARYPQTDMLAMLFLTLSIVALVRVARGGGRNWIEAFAAAGLLLVFTRPAFYMLIGGALGLWLGAPGTQPALRRAARICLGIAVFCTVVYLSVSYALGTPSFAYVIADARVVFFEGQAPVAVRTSLLSHLKGVLHFSVDDPLGVWYAKMLVDLVLRELARGILTVFPLLAIFGLWTIRRDRAFGVLAGAALSLAVVPLVDPISLDMNRVLEFPLLPVLAVGLAAAWVHIQARLAHPEERMVGSTLKKTLRGG